MTTESQPEGQITAAGAVELDETQLDQASGGIIAVAPSPELKLNPTLNPTHKFNPDTGFTAPIHKFGG
jgi:hypothetical protein